MRRLSNSWQLVKASAAVLRADKELLLFPVISAVLSILVVVTFAVPAILAGVFASGVADGGGFLRGRVRRGAPLLRGAVTS